jgi:hypothetical protein
MLPDAIPIFRAPQFLAFGAIGRVADEIRKLAELRLQRPEEGSEPLDIGEERMHAVGYFAWSSRFRITPKIVWADSHLFTFLPH